MTCARQLDLLRRKALEPSGQEQLAIIDLLLGLVYRDHGKPYDVVRPLLKESIALWEACIAQGADPDKGRATAYSFDAPRDDVVRHGK